MAYNLSNITAAGNPADMTLAVNNSVEGALFGAGIVALFFIMLLALRRGQWEVPDTVLVSSFACFLLSSVLSYGGFLNIYYALVFLALSGFTALYLWISKN